MRGVEVRVSYFSVMSRKRLRIAVSACLLGRKVRYDGGHKRDRRLLAAFGREVTWMPVCPEAEAGFGIPREPMRLEGPPEAPRAVGLETSIDRSRVLVRFARVKSRLLARAGIAGCVLKARSPSCAVHDARIFSGRRGAPRQGAGLFAREVRRQLPRVPIADEEDLQSAPARRHFLEAASAACSTRHSNGRKRHHG